jgi:hypothetical protein
VLFVRLLMIILWSIACALARSPFASVRERCTFGTGSTAESRLLLGINYRASCGSIRFMCSKFASTPEHRNRARYFSHCQNCLAQRVPFKSRAEREMSADEKWSRAAALSSACEELRESRAKFLRAAADNDINFPFIQK